MFNKIHVQPGESQDRFPDRMCYLARPDELGGAAIHNHAFEKWSTLFYDHMECIFCHMTMRSVRFIGGVPDTWKRINDTK